MILVVDDDPCVVRALRRLLRGQGHQVACATSASQALDELQRRAFDLVLSDVSMDGMSGIDLAKIIIATFPSTPVVFVSSEELSVLQPVARDIGAAGVIAKDQVLEMLADAVAGAMPPTVSQRAG